jgi:hypothetical protein
MTLEKQVGLPEVEIARLRQALQLQSGNEGGNGRIANTRVVQTRRRR